VKAFSVHVAQDHDQQCESAEHHQHLFGKGELALPGGLEFRI
jgi:hypothetical protein